jgi:hypothetical protein
MSVPVQQPLLVAVSHTRSAPLRPVSSSLPDALPVHLIRNLAVCAVEAIDGLRPIEQFTNWITHEVAVELAARRQLRLERNQVYRDQRRRVPSPGAVTISMPTRRAVEAAIVVTIEGRSFAVAMRLEWIRERWRATCLTVL